MRLDPVKVRDARGGLSQHDIWKAMRRLDVGQEVRRPSWVSLVERGVLEPPERLATCLAAALGVGLSQLLPIDSPAEVKMAALQDDLTECGRLLRAIAAAIGGPARAALDGAEVPW